MKTRLIFLTLVILAFRFSAEAQDKPTNPEVYSARVTYQPLTKGDATSSTEFSWMPGEITTAVSSLWPGGADRWSVEVQIQEDKGNFYFTLADPKNAVLVTNPDKPPFVRESIIAETMLPLKFGEEITIYKTNFFALTVFFEKNATKK